MSADINKLREKFFKMERENNLFDLKDKKGMPLWDIIRPIIFIQLVNRKSGITTPGSHFNVSLIVRLRQLVRFLIYFFTIWNRKYLFFLCTRNYDGNEYFDRIADSSIKRFKKNDLYIIESFGTELKKGYRYGYATPPMVGLARKYIKFTFDVKNIKIILEKYFPEVDFNEKSWISGYRYFYAQYYYYSFLFHTKRISKCFIVQNQYQKGLFAAAHKIGIPVVEFQHGEITSNHFAYSYPAGIDIKDKIYVPTTLLTFGEFWLKDCYLPGVEVRVLGNNFYHIKNAEKKRFTSDVLVISSAIHGDYLSCLIIDTIEKKKSKNIKFYFKLHPNEFEKFDKYEELFEPYQNVEVISGTQMVKDLLEKVAYVVCIQSTVEFEALSMGVKVMIYKRGDYQYISSLFNEDGVFLIDNEDEFIDIYEANKYNKIKDYSDYFFAEFDERIIENYK